MASYIINQIDISKPACNDSTFTNKGFQAKQSIIHPEVDLVIKTKPQIERFAESVHVLCMV